MSRDPEPNLRGSYRLLATAARLVQRRQDEALAPLGLTRAAVIALEAVAPRPLNQEQLAAKVHVQSQTLGRVLARLESQGLVTRTRSETDRRQLQVVLTDAGKTVLNAAREAENNAFPAAMDVEGWGILQQQLARFVESLQGPSPDSTGGPGPPDGKTPERTLDASRHRHFTPGQDSTGLEITDGY
ncbi:MarR family winged helix-turn-helix transcriptional regulator [Pseudarthrobacter sp. MM222]|uniref:MarR family winged helix-turn-helix transcriptional regulator n=1 Tax=Pseudarthrobacter sp. MM222 TaxID=3018929 RepID=UPI00221E78BC|nr:MarR family transcriptional regulator [Pseudarthrobacter sp. MM222]CAI3791351.1 Transcriptional regulator SlyA [Pseudarthrobacter sp. MM222]